MFFPFLFFTTTTFASQSGYCTSFIRPLVSNLSTSSFTTWFFSGAHFLLFFLISLKDGSTFNLCVMISKSISGMLLVSEEKQCTHYFKKLMSFSLALVDEQVLIITVWSRCTGFIGIFYIRSLLLFSNSTAKTPKLFDCQLAVCFSLVASTLHGQATFCSLLKVLTTFPFGSLIVWWKVLITTLISISHGCPRIAFYAEAESTTTMVEYIIFPCIEIGINMFLTTALGYLVHGYPFNFHSSYPILLRVDKKITSIECVDQYSIVKTFGMVSLIISMSS